MSYEVCIRGTLSFVESTAVFLSQENIRDRFDWLIEDGEFSPSVGGGIGEDRL